MDILIKPRTLSGEIRAISSKSDVHRALIAAALADGESAVHFTTLSDDIAATVNVLRAMSADIEILGSDGGYTAKVSGITKVPEGAVLDAGECGTTARLILPIAAALSDNFTLTGKNGLLKRPFADLCECMTQNGSVCSDTHLPIKVRGRLKSGVYKIRGDVSSQYISGLLFALPLLSGDSTLSLTTPLVSSGYAYMTARVQECFGIESIGNIGVDVHINGSQTYKAVADYFAEGDWSNSSFWLCGGALGGSLRVSGLCIDTFQKDMQILQILERAGAKICGEGNVFCVEKAPLFATSVDGEDIPDALPVLATVLCLAKGKSIIRGGARLKIKESDRIATTVAMLKALGADIEASEDGFVINGVSEFSGGTVDAANDHRIAMCACVASQCARGDVIIRGAECVNKSYPTFFEDFEKLGGKYSVING